MRELAEAFGLALRMIVTADPVVTEITLRTLAISASSTLIACLLFTPLACLLHFARFPGRGAVISFIQALYSMPTVLAGLLIFLLLSRTGPLGSLRLLFTSRAIVIAEVFLIAPVILGLVISALKGVAADATDTLRALGAGRLQVARVVLHEARFAVLSAFLMGFGRAISEGGAAMMVGGNIAGRTRTLTTAISLGIGKGEVAASIALGIVLMAFALLVSLLVHLTGLRRT